MYSLHEQQSLLQFKVILISILYDEEICFSGDFNIFSDLSNSLLFIHFSPRLLFGMCFVILSEGNAFKVCILYQYASLNDINPLSSAWKMKCQACWALLVPAFIQISKQIGFYSVTASGFLCETFLLSAEHLEWNPWQHIQNLLPFYLKRNRRMATDEYLTWEESNLL